MGGDVRDEVKIIAVGNDIRRAILIDGNGGEFAEVAGEGADFFEKG